jgi:hypothetical protein
MATTDPGTDMKINHIAIAKQETAERKKNVDNNNNSRADGNNQHEKKSYRHRSRQQKQIDPSCKYNDQHRFKAPFNSKNKHECYIGTVPNNIPPISAMTILARATHKAERLLIHTQ